MPRMQVYLPDDLHRRVKDERLPVSEILQDALRGELSRREKLAELDTYLRELTAEVGEPSEDDRAYAEQVLDRLRDVDRTHRAG